MENDFFLNAGIPQHPLMLEHVSSSSSMSTWQSSSITSSMEEPQQHSFFNPNWEKSTHHNNFNFDSSPTTSRNSLMASYSLNTNNGGKQMTDDRNTIPTPLPEFSVDPGFAARAARFSCFGSRSFNGRTDTQFVGNNNNNYESVGVMRSNGNNRKLPRVSSSPSLKEIGSQKLHNHHHRSELTNSREESTLSEQIPIGCLKVNDDFISRKRKAISRGKSKVIEGNGKRSKVEEDGNGNKKSFVKTEENLKGKTTKNVEIVEEQKTPEPFKDYIHVRARRGQATDSHSLAERVRREKISERMNLLQDLVPGCNKVTGKALMLDEIINYVQSLQRQVEFLSMKLASVNTSLDFNVDPLMSKDIMQPDNCMSHPICQLDSSVNINLLEQFTAATHQLDSSVNINLLEQFTGNLPQYQNFCEDDLHTIVQMGFTHNPTRKINLQANGLYQSSDMKLEL